MQTCSCLEIGTQNEQPIGIRGYIWPSDTFTRRKVVRMACGHCWTRVHDHWEHYNLGMAERFNPSRMGTITEGK